MATPDPAFEARLLAELARRGIASSAELQQALGRSQPTVWRALNALAREVVPLGRQRSARYAWPQSLLGFAGQQPLVWTDDTGHHQDWGLLTHLGQGRLHVQAPGVDLVSAQGLPWFLAPLKLQGFLGRLWARSAAARGWDADPARWTVEQLLSLRLQVAHDAPGALSLGAPPAAAAPAMQNALPADEAGFATALDRLADDVASTLPAGSSAGGEQAKFLAVDAAGVHWLVKFSPPRGTPFGERWHDLLRAEHLALAQLAAHGVPVAASRLVETPRRTHLASRRFDRLPRPGDATGRRHVVPLDAVHAAFVPGPRQHWAASCAVLARQRRLPAEAPAQALALLQFGRLIGNTDMHFGNLSLLVASPEALAAGRFTLAPVYDMLPMRWRPDAATGRLDLDPFTPEPADLASPAAAVARGFWMQAEADAGFSRGFRRLAAQQASRLAASAG